MTLLSELHQQQMFLFLRKEAADVDGAEMFYREAGELCDLER